MVAAKTRAFRKKGTSCFKCNACLPPACKPHRSIRLDFGLTFTLWPIGMSDADLAGSLAHPFYYTWCVQACLVEGTRWSQTLNAAMKLAGAGAEGNEL